MEQILAKEPWSDFKAINELFVGTISSIAWHKSFIIYGKNSLMQLIYSKWVILTFYWYQSGTRKSKSFYTQFKCLLTVVKLIIIFNV